MLGDAKDDSNVTLVCDDNAHKVVLCTSSEFFKGVLADVKDDSNVTFACDDNAYKVVASLHP